MNSIEALVAAGYIHRFDATAREIDQVMRLAERDVVEAGLRDGRSLDWAFSIGYNAGLQGCRAFMFCKGFRPAGGEAHKAVFQFMRLTVPVSVLPTIDYLDRARKKRHRVIYDEPGLVTEREIVFLLEKVRNLLDFVRNHIRGEQHRASHQANS